MKDETHQWVRYACENLEDCNLLDAIYLPSKYPLGSALPDAEPDVETCKACLQIAEKFLSSAKHHLHYQAS